MKCSLLSSALVLLAVASAAPHADQAERRPTVPAGHLVLQLAGIGQLEGITPGDRFQGRFVIWSVDGPRGSVFGRDVPLFDGDCVSQFGPGIQCAQLVAVLSGVESELFATTLPDFFGHLAMRASASERMRVYLHSAPAGRLGFDDVASLEAGKLVGVYALREYVTLDPVVGMFMSRSAMELVDSTSFTLNDITIDLKNLARRMTMVVHGRSPEPRSSPQSIDASTPPFDERGPGEFRQRYAVSGFTIAVGERE